ncbi:MAG: shikimate dehydrogenase [Bacteroidia bacterium]|nr:shikimate dehydrogenase [Bacteroidia bacterium]
MPNNSGKVFGLIGKKLGHSFSKKYFSAKFEQLGIDARYELFELETIDLFPAVIERYRDMGLTGLNVTIPYKTAVIPYMKWLSPEAAAIGAVNTIRVEADGLSGHNSDIFGFRQSLENFLAGNKPGKALVLGTGGAAKAVKYVLENLLMAENILFVSRNPQNLREVSYKDLSPELLSTYPLIVNTTPLGMYPDTDFAPEIPYEGLGSDHFVYDLIYNPEETLFMKKAAHFGARTCNGLDMLILQAEKSWSVWNENRNN